MIWRSNPNFVRLGSWKATESIDYFRLNVLIKIDKIGTVRVSILIRTLVGLVYLTAYYRLMFWLAYVSYAREGMYIMTSSLRKMIILHCVTVEQGLSASVVLPIQGCFTIISLLYKIQISTNHSESRRHFRNNCNTMDNSNCFYIYNMISIKTIYFQT